MSNKNSIDTGDQPFARRRRGAAPEALVSEAVEDTEGHTIRTYPGATTDDELDCRMPLTGEEDERLRRL